MSAVKRQAARLGFALCGVCEARPSDHADFFRGWLDEGRHGDMQWLAENVEVRLDPRKLVEGARSIICVADRIPGAQSEISDLQCRTARYARVTDYHKVLKKRLFKLADGLRERHPEHTFRVCVDTAPLMEREHAVRAGLGWIGKHSLLLNREVGSHLLLGAIVTTLVLPADEAEVDHCGTCTRCVDACPTDAITPYAVDATRCISYLTIEHRSPIDPGLQDRMGDWLFGCDICQDVCPYVSKAEHATGPLPVGQSDASYPPLDTGFDPRKVIDWTEDDRRAHFRGSAMKRAKLDMIRRNALIVLGNRGVVREEPDVRRRVEAIAADADEMPMVRQAADHALNRAAFA